MIDFLDHLVFRVAVLDATERFYSVLLSQLPERAEASLMYRVGDLRLFFTSAGDFTKSHDKERIGLNHLAFGVHTLEDLERIQARLDEKHIAHSGIAVDQYGLKEFIWLDDPDGMRIEFYLRAE